MAKVHVIIGSDSDEKILDESGLVDTLTELGINVDVSVISAHRHPTELSETVLADMAEVDVYICVAGLATALPGATAGLDRTVPVIGVPLDDHGIESILHMPPGVPVNLVGVGKSGLKKAAIAAAQYIGTGNEDVMGRLGRYIDATNPTPKVRYRNHPAKEA